MAQTIVQIRYQLRVPAEEYRNAVAPMAQPIADMPGLQWKVWILDEAAMIGGGVYLFSDAESAQAFLDSPLVAQVKQAPILSDLQVSIFDTIEDLSLITHAPLSVNAPEV
jgi:hypothetical protein